MSTPPLLLIHGAWHDRRQWNDLLPQIHRRDVAATAIDLPGHGAHALPPLPDGRSAHAELTLHTAAQAIIDAAVDAPILVVHSMTGPAATRAVELAPERFRGVIYLTAFVPVARPNAYAYLIAPEAEGSLGGELFVADPAETGSFRIDPMSDAPGYLEALRDAFYTDLALEKVREVRTRLSPDLPLAYVDGSSGATPERWGRVPRGYIRCLGDRTLLPAVQELMIGEADAFAPSVPFVVRDIATSHSPFLSQPDTLAEVLVTLADELASADGHPHLIGDTQ